MRILHLSDTHGLHHRIKDMPKADVIVHLDGAFDPKRYDFIFDGLKKYGARYDMIGLSVYPYWDMKGKHTQSWQETVEKATANINRLWTKYKKPMMVVETGVEAAKPVEGKEILSAIIDMARHHCGGHCQGVFYWAPETDRFYKLGKNGRRKLTASISWVLFRTIVRQSLWMRLPRQLNRLMSNNDFTH